MVARRTSTEIPVRHEEHDDLCWFGPPESKTLRPVWWWNYARPICPRRGHPRLPYIGRQPWATGHFPSILVGYNRERLSELVCLVLYSKLSSCPWAHMSGRAGPTDRSAGLLAGQAYLSGTTETLVGGDPWVPMSLSVRHGYPYVPTDQAHGRPR
jgi:hypothetical protein